MLMQSPAQHNADGHRRPYSVCSRAIHQLAAVSDPPGEFPLDDSKRLCVHLLEKAIASLPEGGETLVGIFDLRGFGNRNADLGFVRFLVRQRTESENVQTVLPEYMPRCTQLFPQALETFGAVPKPL
jgi:hypothetical protein